MKYKQVYQVQSSHIHVTNCGTFEKLWPWTSQCKILIVQHRLHRLIAPWNMQHPIKKTNADLAASQPFAINDKLYNSYNRYSV